MLFFNNNICFNFFSKLINNKLFLARSLTKNKQPVDFYLRKGSSTGLACKSVSNAYSLRHTGSRLNRVKARLYATNSLSSKSDIRESSIRKVSKSLLPKARSNSFSIKQCRIICSSNVEPNLNKYLPDMSNDEGQEKVNELEVVHSSDSLSDRLTWPESDSISSGLGPSVSNNSSNLNSPLPPTLDRMSFVDSTSFSSVSSTKTQTPDLTFYYHPTSDISSTADLDLSQSTLLDNNNNCLKSDSKSKFSF